ncbi:gas vesicle protein GvpN [bacterium]|nr:gas vesicle protein GvpN [bacterium]
MSVDTITEVQPIRIAKEQPNFVVTPYVEDIINRALLYLRAGFPINLSSPAGMGKTAIAIYVAAQIEQPVILIHGDDQFVTSDLVGGEHGYRKRKTVDNFIHSVLKTDEKVSGMWIDNRLTVCCKHGFTLVYDEFTRSRPEANNVLLSVLEERILDLPTARGEDAYLKVHPNFRAIFTSNPGEYAGVYKAQDALLDRMINISLTHYDRDTEISITSAKSGVSESDAERTVDMVRALREEKLDGSGPTIRASIMLAKVLRLCQINKSTNIFVQACVDVLNTETRRKIEGEKSGKDLKKIVSRLVNKYFNMGVIDEEVFA